MDRAMIENTEVHLLRSRWKSNSDLKSFLQSMLNSADLKTWYPLAPKLINPWDKSEACDFRGIDMRSQVVGKIMAAGFNFEFSDFSNTRLSETSLQGALFSYANFENASLHRIQMSPLYGKDVNFNRASLIGGFLMESKLTNCSFNEFQAKGTSFAEADFSESSFIDANFENCKLNSCQMINTNLQGAKFKQCDFSWANLNGSRLTHTIFSECDMSGTDFRGAKLDGTQIRGGTFGAVDDRGTIIPTRFDDTPELRELVRLSTAEGSDEIEWFPITAS
jgi:uncharacterized protein YjbI with pentapeptide repeats